jgi:hypothetical protein
MNTDGQLVVFTASVLGKSHLYLIPKTAQTNETKDGDCIAFCA